MSDTVIKVEGLSKSYTISHKGNERYVALRDVIADKFKTVGRNLFRFSSSENPASGLEHQASSIQYLVAKKTFSLFAMFLSRLREAIGWVSSAGTAQANQHF